MKNFLKFSKKSCIFGVNFTKNSVNFTKKSVNFKNSFRNLFITFIKTLVIKKNSPYLYGQWHMNDYAQSYRRYYGLVSLSYTIPTVQDQDYTYFNKAIFFESRNPKRHISCSVAFGKMTNENINFTYSEKGRYNYFLTYKIKK